MFPGRLNSDIIAACYHLATTTVTFAVLPLRPSPFASLLSSLICLFSLSLSLLYRCMSSFNSPPNPVLSSQAVKKALCFSFQDRSVTPFTPHPLPPTPDELHLGGRRYLVSVFKKSVKKENPPSQRSGSALKENQAPWWTGNGKINKNVLKKFGNLFCLQLGGKPGGSTCSRNPHKDGSVYEARSWCLNEWKVNKPVLNWCHSSGLRPNAAFD